MDIQLTELEAYTAMHVFLEKFYNTTQSDDVGGLLGSMSLLEDHSTADPAIWKEWIECINLVKSGEANIRL